MTDQPSRRPAGTRQDPLYVVRAAPPVPPGGHALLLGLGLIVGGLIMLGFAPVMGVVTLLLAGLIIAVSRR